MCLRYLPAVPALPCPALQVHTVDFFRAMVTDPFLFGQIAANHALSDCHAMGEGRCAMAVILCC